MADVVTMTRHNREFHLSILALANFPLIVEEARRLWMQSAPFPGHFVYNSEARVGIVSEHQMLIEALGIHDSDSGSGPMDNA